MFSKWSLVYIVLPSACTSLLLLSMFKGILYLFTVCVSCFSSNICSLYFDSQSKKKLILWSKVELSVSLECLSSKVLFNFLYTKISSSIKLNLTWWGVLYNKVVWTCVPLANANDLLQSWRMQNRVAFLS